MSLRKLTYFVSDVHLGLDVKDKDAREARFVAFLKSIPSDKTEALYMLGDIWDFWYEYKDVVPKGYIRVFAELLRLKDEGVKIVFIHGNHDIWTYRYFSDLGFMVEQQPYLADISGSKFCLGHGDGLGKGMIGYKLMRWAFHWRPFQIAFSALHPRIAYMLGAGWSKSSRLAKNIPYVFKNEEEPLYCYAEEMAKRQKIDRFVFGHFHCPVKLNLPSGSEFVLLGDWMDGSPYAVFDGQNLENIH